jgi:N-acetylmuramoyl-L-alanine amidase
MIALAYYLLKVIICSGLLFGYYHIALRNKVFHQWNRFYLLGIVVLSLSLPWLQITLYHYQDEPNNAIRLLKVVQSADVYMEEISSRQNQLLSTEQWLGLLYGSISLTILAGAFISVSKIINLIRRHNTRLVNRIKFISTREPGTPFSFFNYIFWNENIDINTSTGQQIFQHELVHVKEAHSFDKLFIQLTLILVWCNPFFWFIRKELQMIHEFIADKEAVKHHDTATLAAMILQASYPHHFSHLTNAFFQSSIKRRLLMLTKIQNPRITYFSRILALPLIACIALAFSFRTVSVAHLEKTITVVIDAGHGKTTNGQLSGASSNNIYEDAIVLAIAKKIKAINANSEINIVLTRTDDNIIELHKRVDLAKENNADLFISLHVAASENDKTGNGMEVYVSNKNTPFQHQSELLGSVIKEELTSIYPTTPELIKRTVGIWVVDKNVCPSVLVECGYITDKKDREFITNEANQELVARKILKAVERYASSTEKGSYTTISDTLPNKKAVDINSVNVDKNKGLITIDYKDGTRETLTIEQARQRKLIKEKKFETKEDFHTEKDTSIKIGGKDKPLIYVDGKEFKGTLDKLDPSLIQSVNVLKDKSATGKYGEKGKNGVIEIITKPAERQNIFDTISKSKPISLAPAAIAPTHSQVSK